MADPSPLEGSYCNPLPLPDYPRGGASFHKDRDFGWQNLRRKDFRETADPTVLYLDGRWYLYPSCGMAYVSDDGARWRHHRIEPYDAGYAPTVVLHRDKFLLTANGAPLYEAKDPLGPFKPVGPMLKHDGKPLDDWNDPMLFADDDGEIYAYWGLAGPGIRGAKLDPKDPRRLATPVQVLFKFNPDHEWERLGDFNEDASRSYVEGPWMVKHQRRYFLTYAAPGTELNSYGMGCYVADKPLGPFQYQARNPILRDTSGLVTGPGHGCLTHGPSGTLWAFYTCLVRNQHFFERRVGMDPAGLDEKGQLFVLGASETPQWAPGRKRRPEQGNDAGYLPVSVNHISRASSEKEGRESPYAIDNSMRTWWEPEDGDAQPWIEVDCRNEFSVAGLRLCWAEPGLDYDAGRVPGPVRYKVEARGAQGEWQRIVDRSQNSEDLLIEYLSIPQVRAQTFRVTILGTAPGIRPGLIQFTLFGRGHI